MKFDESMNGNISFGYASKISVKEKGKVLICLKNGEYQFISNVYYLPNMKNNILNIGQLLEKGYNIHIKNYSLTLRDGQNNLITKVPISRNRISVLNIQNEVVKCLKVYYKDISWFWHFGLGT